MSEPSGLGDLAFRHAWRPYQARVLDVLDRHLADERLHLVAAPGSGKTTLGLEVVHRLGRPALVLSPTRTIRDQWIARLRDFVPEDRPFPPPWATTDLEHPGTLTSATYQALLSAHRESARHKETDVEADGDLDEVQRLEDRAPGDRDLQGVAERLSEAGVGTLVLDEAHHLRAEWWRALDALCEAVPELRLVALTATPPYDVAGHEWLRYEALCGPVDEEISVPELVRSGTLCPHQDFVFLVEPPEGTREQVRAHDRRVAALPRRLLEDAELRAAVLRHPWLRAERPDAAAVLEAPQLAIALMSYQRAADEPAPPALLALLATDDAELPPFSPRWVEVLLDAYLFAKAWPEEDETDEHRQSLAKELRAEGLLHRRELRIVSSRPVRDLLSLSPAKIEACARIWELERRVRGEAVRLVVLADFIRDDDLAEADPGERDSLGAWPIFRRLVSEADPDDREAMALLTGRLTLLHASRLTELGEAVAGVDLDAAPFSTLDGFVRLDTVDARTVAAMTRLLAGGTLRTLVGTRSLLGEGWDAPPVTSLVLASFVGSFVLTNQMRGRAIRRDPASPDKAASIWHLCALDLATPSGLADARDLERRFRTFVGLSEREPVIESGLERLDLELSTFGGADGNEASRDTAGVVAAHNAVAAERLTRISTLHERWESAIEAGTVGRVVPTVRAHEPPRLAPFHFRRTLLYLLMEGVFLMMAISGHLTELLGNLRFEGLEGLRTFAWLLTGIFGVGFVAALPRFLRASLLFLRHLPVDGALRGMGEALRDALCDTGILPLRASDLEVETVLHDDGSQTVFLRGAPFYEQTLFADCLQELLAPIENPRYLLTREERWGPYRRVDHHAVPRILGERKERAEALARAWRRRLGPADLVYTRGPDGRAILLAARARAFSTAVQERSERLDRWS